MDHRDQQDQEDDDEDHAAISNPTVRSEVFIAGIQVWISIFFLLDLIRYSVGFKRSPYQVLYIWLE